MHENSEKSSGISLSRRKRRTYNVLLFCKNLKVATLGNTVSPLKSPIMGPMIT